MYFVIEFSKTEMEKLNLNDQDFFEKLALIFELQMMQFDLVNKVLLKIKKNI